MPLTIRDAIPLIKAHITNGRTYMNFEKVLQSFGFINPEQDIIEFFLIPANDEQRFRTLSNYPNSWKASNTLLTGITAINQASQTPVVRATLEDLGMYQNVSNGISEFMRILKRNDIRNFNVSESPPVMVVVNQVQTEVNDESSSESSSRSSGTYSQENDQAVLDDKDIEIMLLRKKNALLMDFVMNSKDEHNGKWVELCLGLLMIV